MGTKMLKGVGAGSIIGAIAAIAAKKLINGSKQLTLKDYMTWGGGGAIVGGTTGAIATHEPAVDEDTKKELDNKIADLEEKVEDAPTRSGAAAQIAAATAAGGGVGYWADKLITHLDRGLFTNLARARYAAALKKARKAAGGLNKILTPRPDRMAHLSAKATPPDKVRKPGARGGAIGAILSGLGMLLWKGDQLVAPAGAKFKEELEQLKRDREQLNGK